MTEPKVLVVDLGGVACRWLPDRRLVALAVLSGLPPGTIEATIFDSGFDDATERGRFRPDELRAELRGLLGLADEPGTDDALRAAWAQALEPDRRVLRVVERVGETVRTALFTNDGPLLEDALGHELSTVGAAFGQVLCSWRLGATKPDPAAFERATEALAVEPADVFFVDDSTANVDAARDHGWTAHHFRTDLELRAALADAGLLGPAAPAGDEAG